MKITRKNPLLTNIPFLVHFSLKIKYCDKIIQYDHCVKDCMEEVYIVLHKHSKSLVDRIILNDKNDFFVE